MRPPNAVRTNRNTFNVPTNKRIERETMTESIDDYIGDALAALDILEALAKGDEDTAEAIAKHCDQISVIAHLSAMMLNSIQDQGHDTLHEIMSRRMHIAVLSSDGREMK